ncbi:hypothetical protein IE077_000056 [Cardiosporidium cionae]|uniref:C2 domain-containing protein n=1 Tax=Cardiosporidium cionae TaxID=476202 RepID=A0ABQ7JGD2_9APIC|nr:hypothetical protein IE077_000056 [Cardiosporidium cionae]|eukprot:KAF8823047.1 hypothetical protein IE077_000056 [Cardiosporidium cionae]
MSIENGNRQLLTHGCPAISEILDEELSPPHYLAAQPVDELSRNFNFFISLYGIKCSNLPFKYVNDSGCFSIINWDDYSFYKKTECAPSGSNPKWANRFQFEWTVGSIKDMQSRYVNFQVYKEDRNQGLLIGSASVDLLTVATGPIRHDLCLASALKDISNCGRIAFEASMSQICQLVINPIEILVHIHEHLEMSEEGYEILSKENVRQRLDTVDDGNMPPLHSNKMPLIVNDSSTSPLTLSPSPMSGDRVDVLGGLPASSSVSEISSEKAARKEMWEALEGDRLQKSVDSLVEGDEQEPLQACWQLSFIPTGVQNPAEFFSTWTEKCYQPYWNTVDHSLLTGRQAESAAIYTVDSGGNATTMPMSDGRPTGSMEAINKEFWGDKHISLASLTPQPSLNNVSRDSESLYDVTNASHRMQPLPLQILDHLDVSGTYQKLAALCRKGRLVRNVLYHDFPTIQLITSIEQLRRNHLHINLYAKQFPHEEPKFYGESWLPFFKIYDADVVDQMDKHFFDSYFQEKIWYDGKCMGHIEGIMVFQNNPIVRQMYAGVHTESGFMRISPPILGAEHKSVKFNFRNQALIPKEVATISSLHKTLLDTLFCISQHNPHEAVLNLGMRALNHGLSVQCRSDGVMSNLQSVCDNLLRLLKVSDTETNRSFIYSSEYALLTGQRILLNLANHILEYIEYVHWQYRATYCSILHHILRRGEIDIGSSLPSVPFDVQKLHLAEIWIVYRFIKYLREQEASGIDLKEGHKLNPVGRKGVTMAGPSLRGGETPQVSDTLVLEYTAGDETASTAFSVIVNPKVENRLITNTTALAAGGMMEPTIKLFGCPSSNTTEGIPSTEEGLGGRGHFRNELVQLKNLAISLSSEARERVILFHKRMKLCRQYFLLLHRMLYYALNKLCSTAVFEGQGKYLAIFLCFGYFRLPVFRDELLTWILPDEEMSISIEEWRGTEYSLDKQTIFQNRYWNSNSELRVVLDWTLFHSNLKGYFGEDALLEGLKTLRDKTPVPLAWKDRIRSRGSIFFCFLEHWSKHVYQAIPRKELLQWHSLPGYKALLKALLLEMKQREVIKYPDSLLNCSGAMLANERLLSVFIKVLFLRTSVYQTSAVFSALNYVDYWLQVLNLRRQLLPPNFDFKFLKKGLDIILSSDICLNVAKGLWFMYKNLPVFQGDMLRVIIIELMLNKCFIRTFLNWSWLVRRCYMWFLLYRICEGTRKILTRLNVSQQLSLDERIILLAYWELTKWLKLLNAPCVFTPSGMVRWIPHLIRNNSPSSEAMNSHMLSLPPAALGIPTHPRGTAPPPPPPLTSTQARSYRRTIRHGKQQVAFTGNSSSRKSQLQTPLRAPLALPKAPEASSLSTGYESPLPAYLSEGGGSEVYTQCTDTESELSNATDFTEGDMAESTGTAFSHVSTGSGGGEGRTNESAFPHAYTPYRESVESFYGSPLGSFVLGAAEEETASRSPLGLYLPMEDTSRGTSLIEASLFTPSSLGNPSLFPIAVHSPGSEETIQKISLPTQSPALSSTAAISPSLGPPSTPEREGLSSTPLHASSSTPLHAPFSGNPSRKESITSSDVFGGRALSHVADIAFRLGVAENVTRGDIPPENIVYVMAALKEFQIEMNAYRVWVNNGAHPLPALQIPASPLDYNVDVPLDTW